MSTFYFAQIKDYNREKLRENIDEIFRCWDVDENLGEGDTVLLKVNLLRGAAPGDAVTTHPHLVEALAEKIYSLGAEPLLADSPGGPYNSTLLKRHYRKSGYEKLNAGHLQLNYSTESFHQKLPGGFRARGVNLCEFVDRADFIINLPKLKTHGLTLYTGAVKNMFGAVPGLEKAEYHLKFSRPEDFVHMLCDIHQFVSPDLTIMDGITGMEGAGPGSGAPVNYQALLAAEDGTRLDLAVSYLIRGKSSEFWQDPLPAVLNERGVKFDPEEYDYPGWLVRELRGTELPEIDNSLAIFSDGWPDIIQKSIDKLLRPRPAFSDDICTGCGICSQSCPPDVIKIESGRARADLDDCIRCFCCQEMCPEGAVEIYRPLPARIVFG